MNPQLSNGNGHEENQVINLNQHEPFPIPSDVDCLRFTVEWTSKSHSICDLDLEILFYDERVSRLMYVPNVCKIFLFLNLWVLNYRRDLWKNLMVVTRPAPI